MSESLTADQLKTKQAMASMVNNDMIRQALRNQIYDFIVNKQNAHEAIKSLVESYCIMSLYIEKE